MHIKLANFTPSTLKTAEYLWGLHFLAQLERALIKVAMEISLLYLYIEVGQWGLFVINTAPKGSSHILIRCGVFQLVA